MVEDRDILRVAAIQMCSTGNRDANLVRAHSLMEEAVEGGAQLLSLPENFPFIGREGDQIQVAEDMDDGPSVQCLRDFAVKHHVAIVGGSIVTPRRALLERVGTSRFGGEATQRSCRVGRRGVTRFLAG